MKLIKLLTTFFLILNASYVLCQHAFGIKANAGGSSTYEKLNSGNFRTKSYFRPSAQIGVFYRYRINERFFLGSELFFTPINGKVSGTYIYPDTILPPINTDYNHFYGIGFPVYVGYNIRKLNIHLGPQFNFYVANKIYHYMSLGHYSFSDTLYNWGVYRKFDIGARAGAIYSLSKKLSVEVNTYWAISSLSHRGTLYKKGKTGSATRVRQFTLGMRYTLFSNDKKKK